MNENFTTCDGRQVFSVHFDSAELSPSTEEVARYFGGSRYTPNAEARGEIDAAIEQARRRITPVAVFSLHPAMLSVDDGWLHLQNGFRLNVPVLDPHARYLAVAVGSLGKGLETCCRDLAGRNRVYQSTLLDAVGTAMLDALDARSRCFLEEQARKRGLFSGARFSPGLQGYPLEQQQALFRLVDGASAGIMLNEACIMEPVKSISFFRLLSSVESDDRSSAKCGFCRMPRCRFRVNRKEGAHQGEDSWQNRC